jgi:cell division initiation protein
MKISPDSIRKVEFTTGLRGFDKEEVKAYLERFADELEELQKENSNLRKELGQANLLLDELRKMESNLQETLLKAQESAAKTIELSKMQSGTMLKEAENKAAQIVERAKKQAKEIHDSLIGLKEEKNLLIAKLKAIVNSQLNLLNMKIEEPVEKSKEDKTLEPSRKLDVNINDIADKIKNS